jgi:signal transduction histidine kinase
MPAGVRTRTTVLATLVIGIVLGSSAVLLYNGLERTRVQEVDAAAGLLASDLAGRIHAGTLTTQTAPVGTDVLVQVLDPGGRPVLSSSTIPGGRLLAVRLRDDGRLTRQTAGDLGGGHHAHRVLSLGVRGPGGIWTVSVASSLEYAQRTTRRAAWVLGLGTPLLILLVGASTWVVVGRALAPVENIRRTAASVRGSSLSERVPVPASNDEIARLARTVNEMLARVEAAARRQQSFAADASHELRTPLTAARGELELALTRNDPQEWPGAAQAALQDLARLEQVVADLLLLTRADEHLLRSEDVDLDDLVHAEVTRLRAAAPSLSVRLEQLVPTRLQGDPDALARVLRNLGDNAIRHAHHEVVLALDTHGDHATVTVADDGAGVPAADAERIFERFVRLDDARDRERGGTGLGLALCRHVVSAHGGQISVSTGPAATFTVSLPLGPG